MDDLKKVVDERLASDNDFNTRIKDMTDADKATEISKRRDEISGEEWAKADKIAKDQKLRAEKAEQERDTFKNDPRLKPVDDNGKKGGELSQDDMYRLTSAGVHPDDVAEVQRLGKIGKDGKEMTIAEALKDPLTQSILASRTEQRKTAGAQDRGGGRGGGGGQSDAEFLAEFHGGKIPKPGSPEAERLFLLRRKQSATGRQN